MREEPTVIRAIERNGTWYLTLSDGTNARRDTRGRSICLNQRCMDKRMNWDCRHSTAAALWEPPLPAAAVEKC